MIIQNYQSNNFEPIKEYEEVISKLKNNAILKQIKNVTLRKGKIIILELLLMSLTLVLLPTSLL